MLLSRKQRPNNEFEDIYGYFEQNFKGEFIRINKRSLVYGTFGDNERVNDAIDVWNKMFIKKELKESKSLLNDINSKSLDENQRQAVVIDDDSIVLAGAGSGKTLTIAGKVKYLVQKRNVSPSEILLISYTNKAVDELSERISKSIGLPFKAKTFHALGNEIFKEVHHEKSLELKDEIHQICVSLFLRDEVINQTKEYIDKLVAFISYYMYAKNDELDDISLDTLASLGGNSKKITYMGEKVRSNQELMIANFLFLNGIEYEYEKEYPFKKGYRPDFYLPEYDLYLEHYGIDENGNVPKHWTTSSEDYNIGIVWKEEIHKANNTKLICSYSHWREQLIEKLSNLLVTNNVKIEKDFSGLDAYKYIYSKKPNIYLSGFRMLMKDFIKSAKVNNYSSEDLRGMSQRIPNIRTKKFVEVAIPFLEYYQQKLNEQGKYDFDDMINESTRLINRGTVERQYKYIIVDEYQDISKSRYDLINAIKEKNDSILVCVGDDWQAIYGFAGSNLGYITDLAKDSRFNKIIINNNYRNPASLTKVSSRFVQKNDTQVKKEIVTNFDLENSLKILSYSSSNLDGLVLALNQISSEVAIGERKSVLVLSRYNFNEKFLKETKEFWNDYKTGNYSSSKFKNLNIKFSSVHKSKGLEEDYVILVDMKKNLYGFPSLLNNDEILDVFKVDQGHYEEYKYAEERRLFYVALTRTKNKVFVLSYLGAESTFVTELKDMGVEVVEVVQIEDENKRCPRCGGLMRKVGDYDFEGCENFPQCEYTQDIEMKDTVESF